MPDKVKLRYVGQDTGINYPGRVIRVTGAQAAYIMNFGPRDWVRVDAVRDATNKQASAPEVQK